MFLIDCRKLHTFIASAKTDRNDVILNHPMLVSLFFDVGVGVGDDTVRDHELVCSNVVLLAGRYWLRFLGFL